MTRAMYPRSSKRKHAKSSQENIPENNKENLSCITSRSKAVSRVTTNRKKVPTSSNVLLSNDNNILSNNLLNSTSSQNECNSRKSERHRKSSLNNNDFLYDVPKRELKSDTSVKRNALSDQTNSPLNVGTKTNTQSKDVQKASNKGKNVTPQSSNGCTEKSKKQHIPVYKTVEPDNPENINCNITNEKKEAVYEFDEVDENEEPIKKKKKKRRATARKPKIGPKALTINNIKYSSTESLVSLPEKPVKQKKTKPKMVSSHLKPYSSVNNLNEGEDTCYSVESFMSHPPSVLLCNKREFANKNNLSVLQETQSENCQSPVIERSNNFNNVDDCPRIAVDQGLNGNLVNISTVLPNDSHMSQNNSANPPQRCYPSKKSLSRCSSEAVVQCGSINTTLPNRSCLSYAVNTSTGSSHDFLSSTPCKRSPYVARNNSVFNDSICDEDIPVTLRPSTGFVKVALENVVDDDKCFGFDEPEELEEPLVSPIKNINLQEPRVLNRHRQVLPIHYEIDKPKLDMKEVIEQLKASIPKAKTKEKSDVFNDDSSSSNDSNASPPICEEVETTLSFKKPPRRSYERQRRIRYKSEHEEEEDESQEENDNCQPEEISDDKKDGENIIKPAKKCYQKKNVSKVFKAPHVPKAKQKIIKEEEELERLAAQMNAQFQAIEKCNLMVE